MIGANGGSDVETDLVTQTASKRTMDSWVTGRLIDWAAGGKKSDQTKALLREELESYVSELAGPDPSPVERSLAHTAALCWFALRLHEAQYSGASTSGDNITIKQADWHQRRIDGAHRRYLATLKTLASVRKLALPAVQINLARNQLNVTAANSVEFSNGTKESAAGS